MQHTLYWSEVLMVYIAAQSATTAVYSHHFIVLLINYFLIDSQNSKTFSFFPPHHQQPFTIDNKRTPAHRSTWHKFTFNPKTSTLQINLFKSTIRTYKFPSWSDIPHIFITSLDNNFQEKPKSNQVNNMKTSHSWSDRPHVTTLLIEVSYVIGNYYFVILNIQLFLWVDTEFWSLGFYCADDIFT